MTIYGISGLGADERVFQYLELSQKIEPICWIKPKEGETIQSYARRLADQIKDDEFILIAVSFGGLVAVELNKILKPKLTILISSADTKNDLRIVYRLIGKTGLIRFIPSFLLDPPRTFMCWLFGTRNKKLLREILGDTDLGFTKWAIIQLTTWTNTDRTANLIRIHGTKDKLIAYKPDNQTVPIENGQHFMIVDNAKEISQILEEKIKNAG
jgi:alpha-beta hydrolase superfamily lysophospholipase